MRWRRFWADKATGDNLAAGRRLHAGLEELFEGAGTATLQLVAYLDCDRAVVREMAIQLLGWIGPAAIGVQRAVVAALSDPSGDVRMQAGFTVARIGVVDDFTLAALRRALDTDHWRAGNAAATALAEFWPRSRETLIETLRGEPARARYWALRGIKRVRENDPTLVAVLVERAESDAPDNRNEALERLGELDPAVVLPHLERLKPLLDQPAVRCKAARLLAGIAGPELDPSLLSIFVELMQGPQSKRRDHCHEKAYRDVPRIGAAAVEPLAALLRHPESHVRLNALHAIARIEPRPEAVYDHFLGVLDDPELRQHVGYKLEASDTAALPALRIMLLHDDAEVREIAARTARRLGETARPLAPILIERLPEESGKNRVELIAALGTVGGEEASAAIPDLKRAISDPATHDAALSALARIEGPAAVDLAPELISALAEQSRGMCPHPTADADLLAIGPAAAAAVVEALSDETKPRLRLLGLLDEWGDPVLTGAAPTLERWIDGGGPYALEAAERLLRLGRLDAARGEAVFGDALESINDWRRLRGAEGLVRLGGPGCALGRLALDELTRHRHENYRERAIEALLVPCPVP